ncbi:MAG: class I adenylate-forming enzyme family protein [Myxococcota bacterium]|nr:class I adenylate-forming enzyme family protein [Myxococcota bacterium]
MPEPHITTLARRIDELAAKFPGQAAFHCGSETLSWADYAVRSDRFADELVGLGLARGDRVAVLLPDDPGVHVVFVACEKVGLVVMGIGARAGADEIRHLVGKSGARALISLPQQGDLDLGALYRQLQAEGLPLEHHLVIAGSPGSGEGPGPAESASEKRASPRPFEADELFLLNSTSGTTGLPKCVTHHQARWFHFHDLAVEAADLGADDVFLSALPAPFGFGLWTSHFTPSLLGIPCVLLERFSPETTLAAIERHAVTVLAAVSTQFIMLLRSEALERTDLSSLRVLFTGGEAVPFDRAAEFEERTGARVLQFYGSNETGALSRTTLRDSREKRLGTAGRLIESMQVRLCDEAGRDVSASGEGQPACRGPLVSHGYYDDADANAQLYTQDGWMRTGDLARIDEDGYLCVIGRTADIIIRGGKNISAAAVEEAVAGHPAVALGAAVPMPDPVFGERVCVYVELRPDAEGLSLEALCEDLGTRGVSREWFPERLIVVDELPRSAGGKLAKGALRTDLARRLAREPLTP